MRVFPITKISAKSSASAAFKDGWTRVSLFAAIPLFFFFLGGNSLFGADTLHYASRTITSETTSGDPPKSDENSDEDEPTYPEPPDPTEGWEEVTPATLFEAGLHAAGVGFQYWNNYMVLNDIIAHLRNVQLVTYTGDDTPADGRVPNAGTAYNYNVPADQIGQYQYSTGGYQTAPYGPGYAPAYETTDPQFSTGYPVYQDGVMINTQTNANTSPIYRGQAQYGDPGTLIYSLWGGVVGGTGTFTDKDAGFEYKTEQKGGYLGLDLFGSCDCRNGLFYAYQDAKIKPFGFPYTFPVTETGSLYDPESITGLGRETQYRTDYTYTSDVNGLYTAQLNTKNHLIGLYHQFGSEFIYNIATLRFGYDQVKTEQSANEEGTVQSSVTKTATTYNEGVEEYSTSATVTGTSTASDLTSLFAKYDEYLGGLSFERGANLKFLSIMTFTPRAALDYTYMYRAKFDENLADGSAYYHYDKKNYNSLRSQLGADLAMDLYPGDGRLRFLINGGWIHEFLNDFYGKTTYTNLSGISNTVECSKMGRDWGVFGAGAEWAIVPAFSVYANYNYYKNKYAAVSYGDVGLKLMW